MISESKDEKTIQEVQKPFSTALQICKSELKKNHYLIQVGILIGGRSTQKKKIIHITQRNPGKMFSFKKKAKTKKKMVCN